jgi:hypothetical protein
VAETSPVLRIDMSARVSDQPCFLHGMSLDRYGISSHAEHVGEKFLGEAERVPSDHILGLQEPAAKPTTNRVERITGRVPGHPQGSGTDR